MFYHNTYRLGEDEGNKSHQEISLSRAQSEKGSSSKKFQRPGRLLNNVKLRIHTQDAHRLFWGDQSQKTAGLLLFGKQMSSLWKAAAKDDPYADWYLLKVYDVILVLREYFALHIEKYQALLVKYLNHPNLEVAPFVSEKPLIKQFWFQTQYVFMAGQFIADFDLLMRIFLTAKRVGIRFDKTHTEIKKEAMQQVYQLLRLPFEWRKTGVTRQDIKNHTDLFNQVKEKWGDLPKVILEGESRSPFAPDLEIKQHEQTIKPSHDFSEAA